jgi:GT2 family glycosyltransferase
MLKPPITQLHDDFRTSLQWSHDRSFTGFVYDAADLARKFLVEVWVDGHPVKSARASDYVACLAAADIGDGCFGFTLSLDEASLDHATVVEARIANLGVVIGKPIALRESGLPGQTITGRGAIRWLGGLRFSGWVAEASQPFVDILVDGEQVTQVKPSGWCHIGNAEDAIATRALAFHLPERFADGVARRLAAVNSRGEHLEGSPVPFVAFAGGFGRAIDGSTEIGGLRAAMLDQLVPMSVPFTHYQRWRDHQPKQPGNRSPLRAAVILAGSGPIDDTLESLHAQCQPGWVAASLPATTEYAGFDPTVAQAFLAGDGAAADFVVFVLSGAILEPDAILRMSESFERRAEIVAVYGDLDVATADGSRWPLAFPAFDYERMLEQGYCSHVFALRRGAAERAITENARNLYRVFNSILDEGMKTAQRIAHLPGATATLPSIPLDRASAALASATQAHLKRTGARVQAATVPGGVLPAVKIEREPADGMVTVVIPTRNRRELLQACIASIQPALGGRRYELIVVDNDSSEPATLEYLASIDRRPAKVLRVAGDFNFARLNNIAAKAARGEFLCLLNNDVQALDGNWLSEMLASISAADVGAVGALLLWPSGVVQHGGVVLGPNFAATHAFNDRMQNDAGYGDLLRVAHECSAVTAACLLTRRSDYLEQGGMDEFRFPVNFNDVDYCLKLRAAGKRVVFTPRARLLHLESASRGSDNRADRSARLERELRNLRAKWGNVLTADPLYSPVLSLDSMPFSALAWPLRDIAARTNDAMKPLGVPPGF